MAPPLFTVRRMLPGEDRVCEPMWRRGFHEMHAYTYRRLLGSASFWVFEALCASLGAYLYATSQHPLALAGGAGLCLLAVVLLPPLGPRLCSALMWGAVHAQPFLFKPSATRDIAYWVAAARDGGAILGCVAVKDCHTLGREVEPGVPHAQGEASVWRLSVDPAARKLGVGRALMAAAERHASARGCRHMTLITGNDASRAFYLALGYAPECPARASAVLYGAAQRPSTLLGWLRAQALPRRLQSTILMKALV